MRVAIATSSLEKVKGISTGFCRFFQMHDEEIKVHFEAIESGVSNQPFNEETYEGARNRVINLKKQLGDNYDFYVSCEAGIEYFAEAYFNVQVICILEAKTQRYYWGKSYGWQIPNEDISIIKKTNLDDYLRGKGIEATEELLGANYSRREAIAQAIEIALASKKLI